MADKGTRTPSKPDETYARVGYGHPYTVSKAASGSKPWSWVVLGSDGTPLHQGKDCASRDEAEAAAEAAIQGA